MKEIENDKRRYQEMKKKSISGEPVKRKHNRSIITRKEYVKKVKVIMATTATATILGIGATSALATAIKNRMTLNKLHEDFHKEVIVPETHPTDDHVHYYYDYDDIADRVEAMDNFDEGVYYLDNLIGDEQTDRVLRYTDYGSFTNYLDAKGYEDTDDFKKDMKKQVLLLDEIRDKEKELEEMQQEHQDNISNMSADNGKGEK